MNRTAPIATPSPAQPTRARYRPIQDPTELRSDLDAGLAAVLACALAKHPEDRYESTGELAADLDAWLRCEPVRARRAGPLRRLQLFARRRRGLFGSLAAAGVASAAAFAWI